MRKRFTSLLTAAAMALTALPQNAAAADALRLKTGSLSAEAKAGEIISVPITAEANPGYLAGVLDVCWDNSALALTSVEFNSKIAPENGGALIVSDGSYRIAFGDALRKENFTGVGAFFTLTFEVTAEASAGDYVIDLQNADVVDAALNPVPVSASAGTVTLTGDAADPAALILEAAAAEASVSDDAIDVTVSALQNPGFAVGVFDVFWDASALELTAVEYSKNMPDNGAAPVQNTGRYRAAFGDYLAKKDFAEKGGMMTLRFRPLPAAKAGTYAILFGNADVLNAKAKRVPVVFRSGAVILKEQTTTTVTTTTTAKPTTTTTTGTTTAKPITTTTGTTTAKPITTTTGTTTTAKPITTTTGKTTTAKPITTTTGTTTAKPITTTTGTTTAKPIATTTGTTTAKPITTTTGTTTAKPITTTTGTTTAKPITTTTGTTTAKPITTTTGTTTTAKPITTTTGTTTTAKPITTTTGTTTTAKPIITTTGTTTAKPITTTTGTTTTAVTTTVGTQTTEPAETTAPEPEVLRGDVNLDGAVSVEDAQLALVSFVEVMSGLECRLTDEQLSAADVNRNGELSVDDAQYILNYFVANNVSGTPTGWDTIIGTKSAPRKRFSPARPVWKKPAGSRFA